MIVPRKLHGCVAFTRGGKEYLMATGGYWIPSSIIGPGIFWDTTEIFELNNITLSGEWRTISSRIPVGGGFKISALDGRIIGIGFDDDYLTHKDMVLEFDI